jgi:methyltransferase-like protein
LLHEHFAGEDHAIYFHEFMERAAVHALGYLGDADVSTMFATSMGPLVEGNLLQVAGDVVALEHYMDVLRNRAFHRTLLCRDDVRVERRLSGERLAGLWLAGNLWPEDVGATDLSGAPRRFVTFNGTVVSAALPQVEAALLALSRAWPRALAYRELVADVQSRLESRAQPLPFAEAEQQMLAETLVECVAKGFVQAHADLDRFVSTLSERPLASGWTRTEARTPGFATNRRHEAVPLDELSQNLLRYLDGQHDRAALLAVLRDAAASGQMSILQSGIPAAPQAASLMLEQVLDQSLTKLARSALLIA